MDRARKDLSPGTLFVPFLPTMYLTRSAKDPKVVQIGFHSVPRWLSLLRHLLFELTLVRNQNRLATSTLIEIYFESFHYPAPTNTNEPSIESSRWALSKYHLFRGLPLNDVPEYVYYLQKHWWVSLIAHCLRRASEYRTGKNASSGES